MADEYIRKSDAVDAVPKERIVEYMDEFGAGYNYCRNEMLGSIESLEPADVTPVVRCRKCKYFWTYQCMDSMPIETCELAQTFYNPDLDFCSLAKRREE